jgi:hypothetical protein
MQQTITIYLKKEFLEFHSLRKTGRYKPTPPPLK